MKPLMIFAALISMTAHAAGGTEVSGGLQGRILLECQAVNGGSVTARLVPVQGRGLTLLVMTGGETQVWDTVVKNETDPRGVIYQGKNANLLIPNMQGPNPNGGVQAILNVNTWFAPEFLRCVN